MPSIIKLTIDNSTCRLEGLSGKQEKELKELLSYTIDAQAAYFSNRTWKRKQSLLTKRGEFPTGLLYIVVKYLDKEKVYTTDLRVRPKELDATLIAKLEHAPYPEQVEAAEQCKLHGRGIVCAPTGVGKSAICALIIDWLQAPTLVVVPTLNLKHQTISNLKAAFGEDAMQYITVENVDALNPDIVDNKHHCVIIDEFHHSGAKTYRKLNKKAWKNIYYKFGLTATPFRSQDNERLLLESVLSKVIYRVDYQTAVKKNYIVPLEAYYVELPKRKTQAYTWSEVYSELVVGNQVRNDIICALLDRLKSHSTLCLVKEIAHGDKLKPLSGVAFANGVAEDSRMLILEFALDERKRLIGTVGVLGEGVDTKPAEFVIIAGLGKSKGAFMQQCGRGFRRYPGKESCKVILFKDPSHKFTLRHFNAQVKILREEYGVKPIKLEIV